MTLVTEEVVEDSKKMADQELRLSPGSDTNMPINLGQVAKPLKNVSVLIENSANIDW